MPDDFDIGNFINLVPYAWTDLPGTPLRVYSGNPIGTLAQVLPDGQVRFLGAYELRVEYRSAIVEP